MRPSAALSVIVFWLCLLLPFTALAQWPAPLQLTPETREIEVTPHMALLIDKEANLSIEQVAKADAGAWTTMTRNLSMGFTPSVMWLRLEVAPLQNLDINQNSPQWLLEITQPTLTDVRMYHPTPDGHWKMNKGTGNNDILEPSHDHRSALFDLPTPRNQAQIVYVRLQSISSMSSNFVVWNREEFWPNSIRYTFMWGLVYGFGILIIMLHWVFSVWSQNRLHLLYALYIVSTFGTSFLSGGWQLMITDLGTTEQWLLVLGFFSSLTVVTGISFGVLFLDVLHSRPTFAWAQVITSAVVSLASIIGVALGYYINVIPLTQLCTMALICSNIVLAIMELRKGNRKAVLFLWAFGIFYVGVIIRLLRNRGLLEPSLLTENSYQIGAFAHIFIISFGIITTFNKLQQEKKAALDLANKETEHRKEQADFLGMVSHELRTPLTIISSAIDNLKSSDTHPEPTQKRIEKISRATDRMQTLVDSFLNAERMNQTQFEPNKNPCKLDVMLQESITLTLERTAHPITLQQEPELHFRCQADKQLLRIAIDNILSNAVQHSVKGAPVTVSLTTATPYFAIQITNQGNPIDEDDLPRIFERYHRGKNALNRPGTGLGLHVAHTIARNHGGTLEVTNIANGCAFILKIPADFAAQRG